MTRTPAYWALVAGEWSVGADCTSLGARGIEPMVHEGVPPEPVLDDVERWG